MVQFVSLNVSNYYQIRGKTFQDILPLTASADYLSLFKKNQRPVDVLYDSP